MCIVCLKNALFALSYKNPAGLQINQLRSAIKTQFCSPKLLSYCKMVTLLCVFNMLLFLFVFRLIPIEESRLSMDSSCFPSYLATGHFYLHLFARLKQIVNLQCENELTWLPSYQWLYKQEWNMQQSMYKHYLADGSFLNQTSEIVRC